MLDTQPGHRALRLGRVSLPGHAYHVTTTTYDRRPIFTDFRAARVVIQSLNASSLLGGTLLMAWVLMPDHMHLLVQLGDDDALERYVERTKSATARSLNRALGTRGRVWQRAFHDHLIRDDENLQNVARYIVSNPVRAGIVKKTGQYPHWDAIWI